jgi:cell wall assembly regulator SMI1
MAELQATLDELDGLIRTARPELYGRLRPGLSMQEIDRLAEGLRPYHLPSDLVTLYRWHDGWDSYANGEYRPLLPDAQFNSLAESVAQYRAWWETLGADGWHPLWFPAFGDQSGELVALELEAGRAAGGLLSFHPEYDLSTSYDSVAALFATTVECWRSGLLPSDDPTFFPPEIVKIAARHNPRSRTEAGLPRQEISRSATHDWPALWREVLGIGRLAPAADELVVTIAEFVRDPQSGRPIHGEVAGWGGSFDTFIATATDATGSVPVLLSRAATENLREFVGGRGFELWLVPIAGGELVDELSAQMRGIAEVPAVSYLATRIVPL